MPDRSPDRLARRTLLNALTNVGARAFSLGAWLWLTRFMLQHLGASAFGLWVLVGSVTAYGSLFDFGIAAAITKYVSEFSARREVDGAQSVIATALWLYLGLGLAVVVMAALVAPVFPHLFAVQPDRHGEVQWLVLLSGIQVGLSIPFSAPMAVLRGLQRFDLINLLSVIRTTLSFAATVVILAGGGGLVALALAGLSLTVLMPLPAIGLIRRLAPDVPFGLRGAERRMARTVATFSSTLLLMDLGGQLESKTDEIVVGRFLPLSAIAPYNVARRISALPLTVAEQFLSLLMPLASAMDAEKDHSRVRSLYVISTRLTLALFMPLGLSLVVLAKPILVLWVGEPYGAYAPLVLILTLASLIDTSQWPAGLILQGLARHRLLGALTLASGLGNLVLSVGLISTLGLTGVALGTLIPTTVVCLLFVLPYAARTLEVSVRDVLARAFWPALAPAIPALVVAQLLRHLLAPESVGALGLVAGLTGFTYAAGYLAFKPADFERRLCGRLARALVHSARLQWQRWASRAAG